MTPLHAYHQALTQKRLLADDSQARAVECLQQLYDTLLQPAPSLRWYQRLFQNSPPTNIRGIYLYGGPGRGKTLLADMLYETLPFPEKHRWHFHHFMREVHQHLQDLPKTPNPLVIVAQRMAQSLRVLFLDEFHVLDISDVMILKSLLQELINQNVTLVTTSNLPPKEHYQDGLQRDYYLPAAELLETHTQLICIDSPTDYRLNTLISNDFWIHPDDHNSDQQMHQLFDRLAPTVTESGGSLLINQRPIPMIKRSDDVLWCHFDALCNTPRSAYDYLEIARTFHTILISHIPHLKAAQDDSGRRFIHLIDALYDHRVKLMATSAVTPKKLYTGEQLQFAFERTRSRLAEMRGELYLSSPHHP